MVKQKGGGDGKGKRGREGRGEGRESTNFFISFIWFVREKWRETHVIGGSHHKYSLLSLFPSNLGKKNMVGNRGIFSFIFLSFTPIPPNQTK